MVPCHIPVKTGLYAHIRKRGLSCKIPKHWDVKIDNDLFIQYFYQPYMVDFFVLEIYTLGKRRAAGEERPKLDKRECIVHSNGLVYQTTASLSDVIRVITYINREIFNNEVYANSVPTNPPEIVVYDWD